MAKKSVDTEFNMSEAIRDVLAHNPDAKSNEVVDAITAKHPKIMINKNSFSVAFYTIRKKLGIGGRKGKSKFSVRKSQPTNGATANLSILKTTARFLREVGGADAALEAIKQVQAVQVL